MELIQSGMPNRKTAEVNAAAPAETKPKAKRASATKSAVAVHKHKAKTVSDEVVRPAAGQNVRQPSHEDIARLAYSYWEARNFQGGAPEEDWFRAEHELLILAQNS